MTKSLYSFHLMLLLTFGHKSFTPLVHQMKMLQKKLPTLQHTARPDQDCTFPSRKRLWCNSNFKPLKENIARVNFALTPNPIPIGPCYVVGRCIFWSYMYRKSQKCDSMLWLHNSQPNFVQRSQKANLRERPYPSQVTLRHSALALCHIVEVILCLFILALLASLLLNFI